jgi:hypothetical protein
VVCERIELHAMIEPRPRCARHLPYLHAAGVHFRRHVSSSEETRN